MTLALFGLASLAGAEETARTGSVAAAARTAAARARLTAAQAIAAIRDARDPSSAVEAYSRARGVVTRPVAAAQAYVRRMTEFDLPEMAESQARYVLGSELTDPLAKAVIAAMRARSGDADGAVAAIATAVTFGPDEPFVRRTAGRILAWHDTRSGVMAADLESSLETMRRSVAATDECREAYGAACRDYLAARKAKPDGADAEGARPEGAKPAVVLVPDDVQAEFADDDAGPIIYTGSVVPCSGAWDYWSPACWGDWCSAPLCGRTLRAVDFGRCGARVTYGRTYWGGYGYSYHVYGRPYTVRFTPLGSYSRSWPAGGWCAPTRCAPARGGRSHGRGRHR